MNKSTNYIYLAIAVGLAILLAGLCADIWAQIDPQPVVPYASATVFDTTPPTVTVVRSAWPWPTCAEQDVTVRLVHRVDRAATLPGEPTIRGITWLFTDAAGNQTAVIRQERTWIMYGPYGPVEDVLAK